jgi:GxxExxY protein
MELAFYKITEQVIGAAIEVHRELGPGLLESAYELCLCHELSLRKIPFERQKPLPIAYKSVTLDCASRLDVLVAGTVVVEIKSVDETLTVHESQLLSYLKLGGWPVGLLINFNVPRLMDGILRRVGPSAAQKTNLSVSSVRSVVNLTAKKRMNL